MLEPNDPAMNLTIVTIRSEVGCEHFKGPVVIMF